jgi:hypothetical protein
VARDAYNAWVQIRREQGAVLITGTQVVRRLNLPWEQVIRVANGEVDLDTAYDQEIHKILQRTDPLGLVGIFEAAVLLGMNRRAIQDLVAGPGGLAAVATIAGIQALYKDDVLAYGENKPILPRVPGEAQTLIVDGPEIADMFRVKRDTLPSLLRGSNFNRVSPPDGKIGSHHYWLRERVGAWRMNR